MEKLTAEHVWIICISIICGSVLLTGFISTVMEFLKNYQDFKLDQKLPARLERFKLDQFKDGVEAVKLSKNNIETNG